MVRLNEKVINEVRNKADIAEIIGHYIPLIKKGKNLTAVCPFHDDHNPSLSISNDKQIYKCFVCGNGGNVFTFVQNYEKVSFVEAVKKVAEFYNIDIGIDNDDLQDDRYDEKTKHYFKVLNEAIAFLQYQLTTVNSKNVLDYLHDRGYDDDIIKTFKIGFDPDKYALSKFLLAKGYHEGDLIKLNLSKNYDDQVQDVFSERITFPIFDRFGSPIAFTARTMIKDLQPKYVNSTETPLFTKGNTLYNVHAAFEHIRKEHSVYIVEGVTDVIALYKAKKKNVIATLGTALSKQQVQMIKQLTSNVILCYDGDIAGQNANYKNGQILNDAFINVTVVNNDTNNDPDDIIKKEGVDRLNQILDDRLTWIEFVMNHLAKDHDLNNYSQKKDYAICVLKQIASLKDEFDRNAFINRLSILTGFDVTMLKGTINKDQRKISIKKTRKEDYEDKITSGRLRAEYEILAQMLSSPDACDYFVESIGYLPTASNNHLAMLILDYLRRHEQFIIADFISYIDDEMLKDLTLNVLNWEHLAKSYNKEVLFDANNKIKVSLIDEQISELKKKQRMTSSNSKKQEITNEILSLKRKRNSIQTCIMEENK